MSENFDVDLVYLWCDGAADEFIAKKEAYLKKEGKQLPLQAIATGRFEQIDELKYSLRSVSQYLPWIRHIFIVTDNQIPSWLNTNHPKIKIVDHTDFIPQEYLPLFNSVAIETYLHKIPNISEYFLYANDDMFVNRFVNKEFFFPSREKVTVRLKCRDLYPENSLYDEMLVHALSLIRKKFGLRIPLISKNNIEPHHNIDAFLKSDCIACEKMFFNEHLETLSHRFRQPTSLLRYIVSLYSFVNRRASFKNVSWTTDKKALTSEVDSVYFSNRDWSVFDEVLTDFNPALFCINDDEHSRVCDREQTKQFLDRRFSEKCVFEK